MAKLGEINYLRNLGEEGIRHAANKPFSDAACHVYLAQIGAVMSLLPPPPGRLLDLGCGTGWTSIFFAKRGYEVVGVDIAPDMIQQANLLKEKEDLHNLTFAVCDYEELRYSECFDCAVFYDSLHHAVDEALAVRKAYEALRPGGVCVANEPAAGHAQTPAAIQAVERFGVTEKEMPPSKIVELAHQAGFRQARVYPDVLGNRFVQYECGAELPVRGARRDGLAGAGLFKRLFHWIVRWRFGIPRHLYGAFIAELQRVVHWTTLIELLRKRENGVVVLEK
jgi:ubiquinone/menaquinone biosynthesis C-methylase UbiE